MGGEQGRKLKSQQRRSTDKYLVSGGVPSLLGLRIQNGYCKARERESTEARDGSSNRQYSSDLESGKDTVDPPNIPPTPFSRQNQGQYLKSVIHLNHIWGARGKKDIKTGK